MEQHTTASNDRLLSQMKAQIDQIQTIAGTLETIETEHYKKLTKIDDRQLNQIAVEEQTTARQLGQVKQMCLNLTQQLDKLAGNQQTQ